MRLARAILATLTYSDHFGFPLTFAELHSRLIGVKVSTLLLRRTITTMISRHQLAQTKDFYHLPGRSRLVSKRMLCARLSAPLLAQAQELAAHLGRFPGVLAIYLTGSLAMSNTDGEADLDFMIITQPGRLWTTRLLLTLYTTLRGWRRTPRITNSSGKLCLNLYLTPDSYKIPASRRSLYTAYELIQAVPLSDLHHTHEALLSANSWVGSYLPNYPFPSPSPLQNRNTAKLRNLNVFEFLAYTLQCWYMSPKITRELVTSNSAFFHPRDPSLKILAKLSLLK